MFQQALPFCNQKLPLRVTIPLIFSLNLYNYNHDYWLNDYLVFSHRHILTGASKRSVGQDNCTFHCPDSIEWSCNKTAGSTVTRQHWKELFQRFVPCEILVNTYSSNGAMSIRGKILSELEQREREDTIKIEREARWERWKVAELPTSKAVGVSWFLTHTTHTPHVRAAEVVLTGWSQPWAFKHNLTTVF